MQPQPLPQGNPYMYSPQANGVQAYPVVYQQAIPQQQAVYMVASPQQGVFPPPQQGQMVMQMMPQTQVMYQPVGQVPMQNHNPGQMVYMTNQPLYTQQQPPQQIIPYANHSKSEPSVKPMNVARPKKKGPKRRPVKPLPDNLDDLPSTSKRLTCPHCRKTSYSDVVGIYGIGTYLTACGVCVITAGAFGWVPFCSINCQDHLHRCRNCGEDIKLVRFCFEGKRWQV